MPDKQGRHVSVVACGVYPKGENLFVITEPPKAGEAISITVMQSTVLQLIPEQMLRATRKYKIAASSARGVRHRRTRNNMMVGNDMMGGRTPSVPSPEGDSRIAPTFNTTREGDDFFTSTLMGEAG